MPADQPPIDAASHWEYILELVPKITAELSLDPLFLLALLKEDDWSFVIKLHALLEGAVTHLLTQSSQDDRLADFYRRLPLNNLRVGKLAAVQALGLFDPWQLRFVSALSQLRNDLTHDVKNASFTFETFWQSLSKSKKDEFLTGVLITKKPSRDLLARWRDERTAHLLKSYLWNIALMVLSDVYLKSKEARLSSREAALDAAMAKMGYELSDKLSSAPSLPLSST